MMWLFFSLVAMVGSSIWYILPKFLPNTNPFTAMFRVGCFLAIMSPIISKIYSGQWFEIVSWKYGIIMAVATLLSTAGLMLAIKYGGKMGPITIIIEVSLVIAVIAAYFIRGEKLTLRQCIGIAIAFTGLIITIAASEK